MSSCYNIVEQSRKTYPLFFSTLDPKICFTEFRIGMCPLDFRILRHIFMIFTWRNIYKWALSNYSAYKRVIKWGSQILMFLASLSLYSKYISAESQWTLQMICSWSLVKKQFWPYSPCSFFSKNGENLSNHKHLL